MPKSIPIQNIYYLLCYAWDKLDQGDIVDVSHLQSTELIDLFAFVLNDGLRHLSRLGLERGYVIKEEEISGLRGRLDISISLRRSLFMLGRSQCVYDELTSNTLSNQIIKSTLLALENVPQLDTDLRSQIHQKVRQLQGIDVIRLHDNIFKSVRVNSNARFYRFLLNICELIHHSLLVDEASGDVKFRDFTRDKEKMWQLFQNFLLNFILRRCERWSAKAEQIKWRANSSTDPDLHLLPRMTTDISAWRPGEYRIIDAKFYTEALSSHFETRKLHSGNLYQLLSYIANADPKNGVLPDGMLIYPKVDFPLRETYEILGRKIFICTIDLHAPWQKIDQEIRGFFH